MTSTADANMQESLASAEKELERIDRLLSQHDAPCAAHRRHQVRHTRGMKRIPFRRGENVDSDADAICVVILQISIGVERSRIGEVLFTPSLIGNDETGLGEAISVVLNRFTVEERLHMIQHVHVTGDPFGHFISLVWSHCHAGGGGLIHNIALRIEQEIRQISPEGSVIHVTSPSDTHEAWRGGSAFSLSPQFAQSCVSRVAYNECGTSRWPKHFASNG
jgi:actin-related protein